MGPAGGNGLDSTFAGASAAACPALWRERALKKATRLSDDPQCYWQLPRRRLPSRAVLVCRRHFRQLRAAIAPRGFALPQHLNLMSSDAGNRAGSAGLTMVLAHPNDAVA